MFSKKINPTFTATVPIPVPGQAPDDVDFQFHYRDAKQFDAMLEAINDKTKTVQDVCREIVAGWSHPAVTFSSEKLEECFVSFPGSTLAIWVTYRNALFEGKRKN